MAAMANEKQHLTERFNINSLWLDPSELIYNARFRAHFSAFIVRTFARSKCVFSEIWFGRGSLSPSHFHWISIRFDMHADKSALLFYALLDDSLVCFIFPHSFSPRKKPLSLASSLVCGGHNKMRGSARYFELWQIEKIISFYRIDRRKNMKCVRAKK